MTVSTDIKSVRYEGNGVTDTFAFNGRIFTTSDLAVDILTRTTDEVVETLSTSDYIVAITNDESAEVVVDGAKIPSSTQDILIYRAIDRDQDLRLPTGTVFPAKDVEDALDKVTILIQDVADDVSRVLKFPLNVSGISSADLPAPIDGAALIFDGITGSITTSSDYINEAVSDATSAVTGLNLITAHSSTSLTVTGTGEKTFAIDGANKGFVAGMRLRAASDDGTKQNEGLVTSYSGSSLTINVDYVAGSGTHADWNIGVAGARGATGFGSGDLLSTNNLSDVANAATAFNTIKQVASETLTGVVELATVGETQTGTDATRVVTPDALSASTFASIDQSWQDVTASRALSTVYTNNTGRPIMVNITAIYTADGLSVEVDGVVAAISATGSGTGILYLPMSVVVPNGSTYEAVITSGSPSIFKWTELR